MITKSRPSLFPSSRREVRFWKKLGQQSLAVKLIIAISAVVCLVVGIGTMILMHVSRRSIAETSVTTALYQTQLLKNKLVETMLTAEKRHEGLEFLLHSQGKTFGLNEVNIFNTDGKVTFSTIPNNVGKTVTIQPNKVDRATPDDALIKFTDTSKSGKLRIVHPIRGGSQCISCHTSATNGLFGGIELFVPLRPIYERFAVNNSFFIFLALALIVLIAFLIRWTVHRIVKRPLKKLMTVMERAERGELEVKTNIKEDPELRRLAKSFNTMVRGIRSAQKSIEIQHQKELAQSNRLASLGQYISNISHEIKNPLAAISSALHALKSEFETADGEEVFQELRIQLERIERTVNNLLRYARQAPPSFERCRLMNPIHAALESADHRFRESNIRVKIECDSRNQMIEADEGQLEQVFLNLFLNAADAMPKGGLLTIKVKQIFRKDEVSHEGEIPRSGLLIVVEDTGMGIPPDHLERIFEPFFSTKKGGTGLGLSVVKGIIEGHEGTIQIESADGKGTRIILFLPFSRNCKDLVSISPHLLPVGGGTT